MNWLARLKKTSESAQEDATKATEAPFVAFVAPSPAPLQNFEVSSDLVNDPEFADQTPAAEGVHPVSTLASDRHMARVMLFHRRGLRNDDAEQLAIDVAMRLRDLDDRRICLECANLRGKTCAVPSIAGAGVVVQALVRLPQRCAGFAAEGGA